MLTQAPANFRQIPPIVKQIKKDQMHPVDYGENDKCRFVAVGMCGWRDSMEDAHVTNLDLGDGNMLFCVFDGHGGREVARYCGKYFHEVLCYTQNYQKGNYEKALEDAFFEMDKRIEKNMSEVMKFSNRYDPDFPPKDTEKSSAGSTATVLLVTKDKLICANAGDARTVLCKNGTAVPLSEDHKPDDELEKKRIESVGGFVMNGRVNAQIAVSRGIGDLPFKGNKDFPKDQQLITAKADIRSVELTNEC